MKNSENLDSLLFEMKSWESQAQWFPELSPEDWEKTPGWD